MRNTKLAKVVRNILGLILAASMAVAPLSISACNVKPADTPNSGVTDPDKPDNPTTEDSQILQTVLTSSYYNNLVNTYTNTYNPRVQSIPYKFLSNEGYDINKIKSGDIPCKSFAYTKEEDKNNLYLSIRIEDTYQGTPYYSFYVLKYNISDDEYKDLYMLHSGTYIQAPLFIQELDNQKTAKVESLGKITTKAYKGLTKYINAQTSWSSKVFGTEKLEYGFTGFDSNYMYFTIQIAPIYEYMILLDASIRYATFKVRTSYDIIKYIGNDILSYPDWACLIANFDEYVASEEKLTYFMSYEYVNLNFRPR